jgi:hypothetical protein
MTIYEQYGRCEGKEEAENRRRIQREGSRDGVEREGKEEQEEEML